MTEKLDEFARWARPWLFDAALPLWWERGADRVHGGFHEKLDQSGEPVLAAKRLRGQARQVFVYSQAGLIGWQGPWREAVAHGLDFLIRAYRRDDGFYRTSAGVPGAPGSDAFDLYDQAFVLLALASAYGVGHEPETSLARARDLFDRLVQRLRHPLGGFEEDDPRRLPLRSNPHMHMLEALLAWTELGADPRFGAKAREIVTLALDRMIDPATGAIGEYFDESWLFHSARNGTVREPGHQYEWAFLLSECDRLLGTETAAASSRLLGFAERHGVRDGRAIFSVDAAGTVIDGSARLWAQTERLRAMLTVGSGSAARQSPTSQSLQVLRRFLDVPRTGLWRDRITAEGECVEEPAPASSFYHIMTALQPVMAAGQGPSS